MKDFDYENLKQETRSPQKSDGSTASNNKKPDIKPRKIKLPHITHSSTQKDLLGLLFLACPASPGIRGRDTVTRQWANLNSQNKNPDDPTCNEDNFDLLLASAYVSDAHLDLEEFGMARAIQSDKFKRSCFFFYRSNAWKYSLYAVWMAHVVCTWFEQPYIDFSIQILSKNDTNPKIGDKWPAGSEFNRWEVPVSVLALNTIAVVFYWADTLIKGVFCGWRECFTILQASKNLFYHKEEDDEKLKRDSDRKRGNRKSSTTLLWIQVQFITTIFMTIDLLTLFIQSAVHTRLIQVFRLCRVIYIVVWIPEVGRIFMVLIYVVMKFLKSLLIMSIYILVSAVISCHIFIDTYNLICQNDEPDMNNATTFYYKPEKLRQEGLKTCPNGYTETVYSGAFNNPYYGFIRMFTLLTTENYPTLMFPAYWTLNPVVCLWFGAFIFIGVYFIQNLLLAIIVELYWKNNKAKLKKEQNYRRERLLKAWNLVDTFGEDRIHCQSERMDTLVRFLRPELSGDKFQEARLELLNSLDQHGDGWVDSYDWMVHGFNLLNLKIEENVSTNQMQRRSSYSAFKF